MRITRRHTTPSQRSQRQTVMAQYCFVVVTDALPGREQEFNTWYDQQHLADVLRIPGFVAAQRFKLAQPDSSLPGRYLALYELETQDPQAALAELTRRCRTQSMILSEAMDMSKVSAILFAAVGPRRTRATAADVNSPNPCIAL